MTGVLRRSSCVRHESSPVAGRQAGGGSAAIPAILVLVALAACGVANPAMEVPAARSPQVNQAAAGPAAAGPLDESTDRARPAAAPRPALAVPKAKPEAAARPPSRDRERPRARVMALATIAEPIPAAPAPAPPVTDPEGYAWPVRGRIVRAFGDEPNGGRSDGIDIRVAEGTFVLAARGGTVAYAGSEIRGYGRMLLLAHAGGFTTVYARNRELLVGVGERVRRGQPIATVGSADVGGPRLHFQLRSGGVPLDPARHLQVNETVLASASLGEPPAAPGE
jgi:murein DD-endopeptidase MepM/ murein hydrolase activator NlpD